ncbi:Fe-S cluster assembly sulfur transfer protein SufU [Paenibacillus agricola]|uniref:SUF system NifU family Fe-S cluster assembly protein n=1 Tax=Paenibacillus agricola TaxID=2716264 RepID=A0ABX0J651_9BACL|nr:SUF system NifU family Fe-S cluster assembly protein [Paenibacillus agricola]NHN31607.1 SUF system NifU family Fe-S cluster assembly protein [Paenibacillus agricola]
MQLDDLYRRVIMDHYKTPRNRGTFEEEAVTIDLNNPTCGDKIQLQLQIEENRIKAAKFVGEGCSISLASASMMTAAVKGKTVEEALEMAEQFSKLMKGEPIEFEYEDIDALSGVNKFPARIKCATLGWNALRKGVAKSQQQE